MGFNVKKGSENSSGPMEALPTGRYPIRVTDAVFGTSDNNNPKIDVTFTVISGEYKNRKLWNTFTLTEKAFVFLGSFLKACNSDLVENEDIEGDAIAAGLIGLTCTAYTEPSKTPAGNPKNELKNWAKLDTSDTPNEDVFDFS